MKYHFITQSLSLTWWNILAMHPKLRKNFSTYYPMQEKIYDDLTYLSSFEKFVLSLQFCTRLSPSEDAMVLFRIDIDGSIFCQIKRQWNSRRCHHLGLNSVNFQSTTTKRRRRKRLISTIWITLKINNWPHSLWHNTVKEYTPTPFCKLEMSTFMNLLLDITE